MTSTLNHEEYEPNDRAHSFSDEPTVLNLVYGKNGWTDAVEGEALDALVRVRAIFLERTVTGMGWKMYLYRSVEGYVPEAPQ